MEHFASQAPKQPHRIAPALEQEVIELRRQNPQWGKQRLADEMAKRHGWQTVVSANTVKRILDEAGLWSGQETQAPKGGQVA